MKDHPKYISGQGKNILVIDDEQKSCEIMGDILVFQGFNIVTASNGADAIDLINKNGYDCILCDVQLPGLNGIDVLDHVMNVKPAIPVIMISGFGTIQIAVEATQKGAFDFLEKPVDANRMLLTIRNALAQRSLMQENTENAQEALKRYGMIGNSPVMKTLFYQLEKVAPSRSSVIIRGETGTGKELIARAIHKLCGNPESPFVTINCAAIPQDLIESQLFGHRKGAFTNAVNDYSGKFVEADGGTLFLDEITELSLSAQAKLLRAVELGEVEPVGGSLQEVDVRLLAATQVSLRDRVKTKQFREDLFYRLNVVELVVPPLRERQDDIAFLANHFFDHYAELRRGPVLASITAQALRILALQPWPGNVRELQHIIERAVLFAEGPEIDSPDIYAAIESSSSNSGTPLGFVHSGLTYQEAKKAFEKSFLNNVLKLHKGSITEAAKALKIDRTSLWRKLKNLGIG